MLFGLYTTIRKELLSIIEDNLNNLDKKNYFLFGKNEDAFLVAHGTTDGRIKINNDFLSTKDTLKKFLPLLEKKGINRLYTICCHGGVQEPITIQEKTIQSLHPCIDKVSIAIDEMGVEVAFESCVQEMKKISLPKTSDWEVYKLINKL